MVRDAERDVVAVGEDQTRTALLRRAANAAPVGVAVAPVEEVVDDQEWLLALAEDERDAA